MLRASTLFSLLGGIILLAALMIFAHVDGKEILLRMGKLNLPAFFALVALWMICVIVSAKKWLLIEKHLHPEGVPPLRIGFALTSLGWVAGQISPAQVSTAFMRGLGSRILAKRGAWRSAAATLYEQAFDLGVTALLSLVSLICLFLESPKIWLLTSPAVLLIFFLVLQPGLKFLRRSIQQFGNASFVRGRFKQFLADLAEGRVLDFTLVRRLTALSIFRFVLLCAAAAATTQAAGLSIPALDLAVAMPLVTLASLVPITPGALGVNEFVFASALAVLGTPFETGLQWALINRILVVCASLLIGAVGVALLWIDGYRRSKENFRAGRS